MALYPYQAGLQPLGQFDVLDSYAALINGGEVGSLFAAARANAVAEKSAYDVKDGYDANLQRAAVAPRVNANTVRPLWLLDDGIAGYGTLFGSLIGSPVGLCTGRGTGSTCATTLGPSSLSGSGKVTCWDKPGLYGISSDAVDTGTGGLILTTATAVPGVAVRPLPTGVLTISGSGVVSVTVGRFVEFETSPFLVTTPPVLVGATESVVRVVLAYNVEG